ncbi:MAG: hypothetical protein H6R14_2613 [Proteobacteria bacterium]|nr:hypothetical protein [Pseudomonadota bacterium]
MKSLTTRCSVLELTLEGFPPKALRNAIGVKEILFLDDSILKTKSL